MKTSIFLSSHAKFVLIFILSICLVWWHSQYRVVSKESYDKVINSADYSEVNNKQSLITNLDNSKTITAEMRNNTLTFRLEGNEQRYSFKFPNEWIGKEQEMVDLKSDGLDFSYEFSNEVVVKIFRLPNVADFVTFASGYVSDDQADFVYGRGYTIQESKLVWSNLQYFVKAYNEDMSQHEGNKLYGFQLISPIGTSQQVVVVISVPFSVGNSDQITESILNSFKEVIK